jgi:uncharacterized short protein YbdD (DUF466 family)
MSSQEQYLLTPSSEKEEGVLRNLWCTLRTLTGDDAYEKYCEHHRMHHADEPLLDKRAFYIANQQKKWGGINRCC